MTSCSFYLNNAGNACLTTTECDNLTGTHFKPTDGNNQKHCLTKVECEGKSGYLFDLDNTSCILESACTGSKIKLVSTGQCSNTCSEYLNAAGEICYSSSGCDALTGTHFKPTDGNSQKYCLTETECKAKTDFLYDVDSSGCILTTACTSPRFKITELNECRNACNQYLNNAGDTCYTSTECDALTGTHFKPTGTDNQKHCLTQAECQTKAGFLFDVAATNCIKEADCTGGKIKTIGAGQCVATCTDYLNNAGDTCYTSTECDALTGTHFKPTDANSQKHCLTQTECEAKAGFVFDTDNNSCILETACTSPRFKVNNQCMNACNQYLNNAGNACYTSAECDALTGTHFKPTGTDNQKHCLTQTECQTKAGFLYDVAATNCIKESDCTGGKVKNTQTGQCTTTCSDYLSNNGDTCYTEAQCNALTGTYYKPTAADGVKYCLTQTECEAKTGFLFDVDNNNCILETTCTGTRFKINNQCTNTCSLYLNNAGNACYTEAECDALSGTHYKPTDANNQKHCLTQTECESKSGLLFDTDNTDCILETACTTPRFKITELGQCMNACAQYLNNAGNTCYTSTECDALTGNHFKPTGTDNQKHCLTQTECQSKSGFLFDVQASNCIKESDCSGAKIKHIQLGQCQTTCTDYLNNAGDTCYTSTECDALTGTHFKPTGTDNQKHCLTQTECEGKTGFLFDVATTNCIKEADCSGGKIKNVATGQCVASCANYLNNAGDTCYTSAECDGLTGTHFKPTGTDNQKHCLTQTECEAKTGFIFDIDNNNCILTTACTSPKFNIAGLGQCMNSCSQYLNNAGDTCYTSTECDALTGTHFKPTGTDNQKHCLTQTECEGKAGFLYDVAATNCIKEADCSGGKIKNVATGQCVASCANYLNNAGDTCYTSTECDALTGTHFKPTGTDNQKHCLTQAECQTKAGFLFDIVANSCIKEADCTGGTKVKNASNGQCSSTCSNYLNNAGDTCYTEAECDALAGTHYKPTDASNIKYCLTQSECQTKAGFIFDTSATTCIKETDCTGGKIKFNSQGQCVASCSNYLNNAGDTCYTLTECDALAGTHYKPTDGNNQKHCLTQTECEAKTGFLFDTDNNSCILTTACTSPRFKITELNQCVSSCSLYLNNAGDTCHTSTECDALTGTHFKPTGTDNQKHCLTQAECQSKAGFLYDVAATNCIKESDCSGGKIKTPTGSCIATCSDYLNSAGDTCYTSTECDALTGTHFKPTDANSQKHCLTQTECEAKAGFVFDTDNNSCILETACTSPRFKVNNQCMNACNQYLNNAGNACYTSAECDALTGTHFKLTGTDNQKHCLTKVECEGKSGFLFDTDNTSCIKESDCSGGRFKITALGQCMTSCSQYLNNGGDTCYTSTECDGLAGTHYKPTDANNQKYCLTQTECEGKTGFLFDTDATSCIKETDCSGSKIKITGLGRCSNTCSEYLNSAGDICHTSTECDALTGTHYKPTDANSQKHCLTQTECQSKSGFLFDTDNNSCILTTACSSPRFKVTELGQCMTSCNQYLNNGGDKCYTSTECDALSGTHFKPTGADNQKHCLTQTECEGKSGFLYDVENTSCILETACTSPRFKVTELNQCMTSCSQYLSSGGDKCYTSTECDALTGTHFKPTGSDNQKHCLTREECQSKSGFLFDTGDTSCIKESDCTSSKFKITELGQCTATCSHYLNNGGDKCYTETECNALTGTYFKPTDANSQKHCLTQTECQSKSGFLFDTDNTNCILTTACTSPRFKVTELGQCMNACNQYLDNAGTTCYTSTECDALSGTHFKPTGTDNQKHCLTQTECEGKSGFLYDVDNTNCVLESSCISPRFKVTELNQCMTSCNQYLDNAGTSCYTSTECDALSGTHFKPTDANNQKHCLTQTECESKSGFLYDVDNTNCIKETDCTQNNRFAIKEQGKCQTSCTEYLDSTEKLCYTQNECTKTQNKIAFSPDSQTGQKRCFSSQECKSNKFFLKGTTECLTQTQCQAQNFLTVPTDQDCLQACPDSKKFIKDKSCYAKCPTDGEFGQTDTNLCVPESECQSLTLTDGTVAKGVGNTETGECDTQVVVDNTEISKNENYDLDTTANEVNLKYDPRTKQINDQENKVSILLPFDMSIFEISDVSKLVKSVQMQNNRRLRILQNTDIKNYNVVISEVNKKEGYVVFDSPSNQKFKVKVNFDTDTQFTTKLADGSTKQFKLGVSDMTFVVPENQSKVQANEPTGIFGIFTAGYDIYMRLVSPFLMPHFQPFIGQNYQRMNLLSHLNFWDVDINDWLYVKTFKDWISEGGMVLTTDKLIDEEVNEHCKDGRTRPCFYKKNFTLMTAGVGCLIVLGLLLILLIVGVVMKPKSDDDSGLKLKNLFLYNVFPKGLLALQTNFLFYLISSVSSASADTASYFGSLFLLITLLVFIVLAFIKDSALNKYCVQIHKRNFIKMSQLLIIASLIYDFGLAIIINSFEKKSTLQSLFFLALEIFFLVMILISIKPNHKFLFGVMLGQRVIAILQAIIGVLLSAIDVNQKTWHLILFIFSFISIILSIVFTVMAGLEILKGGGDKDDRDAKGAKAKDNNRRADMYKGPKKKEGESNSTSRENFMMERRFQDQRNQEGSDEYGGNKL